MAAHWTGISTRLPHFAALSVPIRICLRMNPGLVRVRFANSKTP